MRTHASRVLARLLSAIRNVAISQQSNSRRPCVFDRLEERVLLASVTQDLNLLGTDVQAAEYAAAAPANDNFADRVAITSLPASIPASNVGATKEVGEPNHAGEAGGASVWWSFTPTTSSIVTVDTVGSSIDTLLAVYTGTSVSSLTEVASSDDYGGYLTGKVSFRAAAGATYQIAVDGYDAEAGDIVLNVNAATVPANDDFANRTMITGTTATVTADNTAATSEANEPNHYSDFAPEKSVWWTWTAPADTNVQIDTRGSDFDTLLAVYTGTSLSSLSTVVSNDQDGTNDTSRVMFQATGGTTYQIAVDGFQFASGQITLHLNTAPGPVTADSVFASTTFGDKVQVSWASSPTATEYEVWRGTEDDPTLATRISGGALSATTFDDTTAVVGIPYFYWVRATSPAGTSFFSYSARGMRVSVPPNDNFANATVIDTSVSPWAQGSNSGASKEAGEPNHADNVGGHSVWWKWTAANTGTAQIDTMGSDFDTLLAVYTGSSVTSLNLVAANDDSGDSSSRVWFHAVAGTTYQIAVDGFSGEVGGIWVTVDFQAGPMPATDVTASDDLSDKVHIAWTASPDADTYEVWRNTSPDLTSAVRINASNISGTSYDDLSAQPGTSYWYWVRARNAFGLDRFGDPDPGYILQLPGNDNFADRVTIEGTTAAVTARNADATKEAGEPNHAGDAGGHSLWWTWTAPSSGNVTLDTSGSDFDTLLAVYTGTSVTSLTEIASNDQDGINDTSKVVFYTAAGTTYQIAVDGYMGDIGNIALNLALVDAPQPAANVAASDTLPDRVQVTWTASSDATAYDVVRSSDNNPANAVQINTADITGTSYDDTTAVAGVSYWYWIIAKGPTGPSLISNGDQGLRTANNFTGTLTGTAGDDAYVIDCDGTNYTVTVNGQAFAPVAVADWSNVSFGGVAGGNDTLKLTGSAAVTLTNTAKLAGLDIASGAKLSLSSGGDKVLVVNAASPAAVNVAGTLDLADNDAIIQTASAADRDALLATLSGLIGSARNGGTWNHAGITSSAAQTDSSGLTGLAISGGAGLPAWTGQSFDANSVLIKYTFNGDADLNGMLDGSDYFFIDKGYLARNMPNPPSGYHNGDFDLNGIIDGSDYFLIDKAFLAQKIHVPPAPLAAVAAPAASMFSAKPIATAKAVLKKLARKHRVHR